MEEVSVNTTATHYSSRSQWCDGLHAFITESKQCCTLSMGKDEHRVSMTLYKHDVEALSAILSAIAKSMEAKS